MDTTSLIPLILTLLAAGCVSGVIAGLFGVGGGLVMVPALFYALNWLGYGPVAMHMALATSLAVIIPTSVRSLMAHHRRGAVDQHVLRSWAPWVVASAAVGSLVAAAMSGVALRVVFGAVAVMISPLFLFGTPSSRLVGSSPKGLAAAAIAIPIGGLSAVMGIGGGLLGVTAMTLCSVPIHRAVGTSSALGFMIGAPAVVGYVLGGWDAPGRPPLSLGYVSLSGLAVISIASVACAPLGAALAHRLNASVLRRCFGAFIALNGLTMLVRVLYSIGG